MFWYKILKSNKYLYFYGNDNHLLNGFFVITTFQQRNNRALLIFIKFMRSLNDKRVNKLSSRISLGTSNILVCIKFDIISRYCKTLYSFKPLEGSIHFSKDYLLHFVYVRWSAFVLTLLSNQKDRQRRKIMDPSQRNLWI